MTVESGAIIVNEVCVGINQGVNKLNRGFSRRLTKSEVNRGYIFISNDRIIKGLSNFDLVINDERLGNKTLDKSGRVGIGRKLTNKMQDKSCRFKLKNRTLIVEY